MAASEPLRDLVVERAGNCCEYCLLQQEDDDVLRFAVDRVISAQHGGV